MHLAYFLLLGQKVSDSSTAKLRKELFKLLPHFLLLICSCGLQSRLNENAWAVYIQQEYSRFTSSI